MGAGDLRELPIESGDLVLEALDFVDDERDHLPKDVEESRVWVSDDGRPSAKHGPRADWDRVAVFRQQSSDRIDPSHTGCLPLRPHPMEGLERVRLNRLYR